MATVPGQSFLVNKRTTNYGFEMFSYFFKVNEMGRESTEIAEDQSGSMREGSGSQNEAVTKLEIHVKQQTQTKQKWRK